MSHCFTSEIFEKFFFKLSSFMNCVYCEKIVTGLSLANQTRLFGVFFLTVLWLSFPRDCTSFGLYLRQEEFESRVGYLVELESLGTSAHKQEVWCGRPPASTGDFYIWQSHFVWDFSSIMKTSLSPPFKVAFHVGELFKRCWVTEIEAFDCRFS